MKKLPRTILTLQKRTDTLRTLIKRAASEDQLHMAAKRIREARIQVLRAKIGELSPALFTSKRDKRIEKLSTEIEFLHAIAPQEILNELRQTLPKSRDD